MKTNERLQTFLQTHSHLRLIDDQPEILEAIQMIDEGWYLFFNPIKDWVEVCDINRGWIEGYTSGFVLNEPNVSWKIVHDLMKYNTKVYDAWAESDKWDYEEDQRGALQKSITKQERRELVNQMLNN